MMIDYEKAFRLLQKKIEKREQKVCRDCVNYKNETLKDKDFPAVKTTRDFYEIRKQEINNILCDFIPEILKKAGAK